MLSGRILPKNASIFTCSHPDLNSVPGEKPLDPCLQGKNEKGREWRGKGGEVSK